MQTAKQIVSLLFYIVLFVIRLSLYARIILNFLPPGRSDNSGKQNPFVTAVMFITEPVIFPVRHWLNRRDAKRNKVRVFDYSPVLALLAIELFILAIYNY